jgi:hypothetical protein
MHQKGILRPENNFPFFTIFLHIIIKSFKRWNLFTQFHNICPLFLSEPAIAWIRSLCTNRSSADHQESDFLRRYYFLFFLHDANGYEDRKSQFVFFEQRTDYVLEKSLGEHVVYVFDSFETARDGFFYRTFE